MPLYHICFDGSVGLAAITFKAFFQCVILLNMKVACKMAVANFGKPPFLDPVHAPGPFSTGISTTGWIQLEIQSTATQSVFDWLNLAALDPDRADRAAPTAGSQSNGHSFSTFGVPHM